MPDPSIPRLTADGAPMPGCLRLEFSKAADYDRFCAVFQGQIKAKIDPRSFVVKREDPVVKAALEKSGGVFLSDGNGEIFSLSMAYHMHASPDGRPVYTEIGTSLSRIRGYHSAQLLVAAVTLREWWANRPSSMIVAEILPTNPPSLATYRDRLKWPQITDKKRARELHNICNETISAEDKGHPTIWFRGCRRDTLIHQAGVVLRFMNQNGMAGKDPSDHIPVDFTALAESGLTRSRLEAIATGTTVRRVLARIAP